MITNFEDFRINEEILNLQKINEEIHWEFFVNQLFEKLEAAIKVGESFFIKFVIKMLQFFKTNPKALVVVVGLLIFRYDFSKQEIVEIMPKDTIISSEEIYQQSLLNEDPLKMKEMPNISPIFSNFNNFLSAIAKKESGEDPEKINNFGYMGKYQFGQIALKDILKRYPNESEEQYKYRIGKFWPNNFGTIKDNSDFKYFQSKFKSKGEKFWPEHKQDQAMKQLLKNNKSYLGNYINKWVGKKKRGINITLSGLLAGAHLLGASQVKDFLDHGRISKDAYGTPITEYIKKFGGYNLNL